MTDNELNALVATKVMGYKSRSNEAGTVYAAPNSYEVLAARDLPDYANDIAAAWQVVEKYRLVVRPTVTGQWCAAVLFSGGGRVGCSTVEETYAEAHTAPRAICLAALKVAGAFAVAVENKDKLYFGDTGGGTEWGKEQWSHFAKGLSYRSY